MYTLNDLLMKIGAPEVKEKGRIRWHYFDSGNGTAGGFAEIRMLDGGAALIAEMQCLHRSYEDDNGILRRDYSETFYLHARRRGARYQVTKIAFDGEEYAQPPKSIVELGLSIFHARALDISILMVEQSFNKDDILSPIIDDSPQWADIPVNPKPAPKKAEAWGVVVPFKPRAQARAARL